MTYVEHRAKLLDQLIVSKGAYRDAFLDFIAKETFYTDAKGETKFRPMTEERARYLALERLAQNGIEDPEIVRWRLALLVGVMPSEVRT